MKKLLTLILPAFVLCGCSSNSGVETASSKEPPEGMTSQQTVSPGDSHTLVTYFSVTNHTENLANYAKEHLQSDIFEIVPKQEYTADDINYNTDCRANREQNDDSARPEILYTIEDISQYDTIVLGYPIWWGQAPKILYTFVESYNLSGKTILPFCTSGSSPIGSSATNLSKSAPNATWLEGRRFAAGTSKELFCSFLDESLGK